MAVTIRDVAKHAGISIATVSRVLNNSPDVTDETRRKVEESITKLGYVPPVTARGFNRRSLKTVGVLIPDINNMYYPAVIRGIEDAFSAVNYNIFLCNTDEDIEEEKQYIRSLLDKGVDGIMFLGTRPTGGSEHLENIGKKLPVLMINDYLLGSDIPSVMADEVEGAYKAIDYLLGLGHRDIAFINGDVDFTTYHYKYLGYERAFKNNGLAVREELIVKEDPHEEGGYRAAQTLLDAIHQPTAIFTASDQIAVGVMKAVYERGMSIPGDYSLIGFSDIPIAKQLYPELTTVNQFPYRTGTTAVKVMMDLIIGKRPEQKKILLEPELSVRKSCRPVSGIQISGKSKQKQEKLESEVS